MGCRLRQPLTVLLLAALALARVAPAAAFSAPDTKPIEELLDRGDPYQAFDVVAGYEVEATRLMGFAHCLPEVLVRRLRRAALEHDPRVKDLAAHAADLVASSTSPISWCAWGRCTTTRAPGPSPLDLVVRFDQGKIDAALATLGVPPWHGPRPEVMPVSRSGMSPGHLLSAEVKAGEAQRGWLATAATQYGLPLRVPSEAELAAWAWRRTGFRIRASSRTARR